MELRSDQRAVLDAIARDRALVAWLPPAPAEPVTPRPERRKPVEKPRVHRRPTAVCPSYGRYDRHRRDGETCDVCAEFVRERKREQYAATPAAVRAERAARATARRRAKAAAALPAKLADMAARKAAVMARFPAPPPLDDSSRAAYRRSLLDAVIAERFGATVPRSERHRKPLPLPARRGMRPNDRSTAAA